MSKTLIVILSDPKSNTEEAAGRAFNAMAMAYDLKERKMDVKIVFQGAATRWVSELSNSKHAFHALYAAVLDKVEGACGGCADVFGAAQGVKNAGMPMLRDNKIPGTEGLTSIGKFIKEGYSVVTF